MSAEILVVDSDRNVRLEFASLLSAAGCRVTHVSDGADGLRRLYGEAFDLLITELVVPKVDGAVLIEFAREEYPDMPVLVISAAPRHRLQQAREELSVQAMLEKPVQPELLLARVEELLASSDRTERAPSPSRS